jgi:CBS domain-containing protein
MIRRMSTPVAASARALSYRVGDAMRPGILMCRAATPLREAALLMASRRVHCVVVRATGSAPTAPRDWTLLSDLDLARAIACGRLDEATAGDVASVELVTVSPDSTLEDAARLMVEHASAHLVVTGRGTGAPVGVLSTLDLAAAIAGLDSPSLQLVAASY